MRASQQSVSLAQAIWRGFRTRCPHCGQGTLFRHFLKVADHCPKCAEELFHHRADDFPTYLVIAAVGHVIVPAILAVETSYAPALWLQLLMWLPVTAHSHYCSRAKERSSACNGNLECMDSKPRNSGAWPQANPGFHPKISPWV
jgi:uncharacterized protein (DUF983 family)